MTRRPALVEQGFHALEAVGRGPFGIVRQGGIYHEVLEEAKAIDADLIVMSSHRPAMRTYFLGSNAGHVVRYAKWLAYLGDTLDAIAREKAGILKPGTPLVLGPNLPPDALAEIRKMAGEQDVPLTVADSAAICTEADSWTMTSSHTAPRERSAR